MLFPAPERRSALLAVTLIVLSVGVVCWSVYAWQTPSPSERGLTIENEGAQLAATVWYPAGRGPFPGVVLVHGSGRMTRHDLARQRDHLVSKGVAVLAYDKRGVGESTGEYDNVGVRTSPERMPLLARDALACLRTLRAQPRIDATRLGLFGGSQAGWIIPAAIAAAKPGEVRFAIILSGPATSVGLEHAYSEATGDGIRAAAPLSAQEIDARVDAYKGPMGFDHGPIISSLRTPTLWLLGDADESIPIRHTVRNLRDAIAGGATITMRIYEGANHALRRATSPVPFWTDVNEWLRSERIVQ